MIKGIYILLIGMLYSISVSTQSLPKSAGKLHKLYDKNPDKALQKAKKLSDKKKDLDIAYYYLTISYLKKYSAKNSSSYLSSSLRYYEKYKKQNSKRIPFDTTELNQLELVHQRFIKSKYEKRRYSSALKESKKHKKLFGFESDLHQELLTIVAEQKKNLADTPPKKNTPNSSRNNTSKISVNETKLIADAETVIGTRYKYGGESTSGLDCSGFTKYVYQKSGLNLPHSARLQSQLGTLVKKKDCQPGDLIFFGSVTNSRYNFQHVGMIYSNENGKLKIIHCPSSGVKIEGQGEPSYDMYWEKRFLFIKRLNKNLLTSNNN